MASGIVFDIKKFAIHDGPGIRTTVFLKGCSLDCWWCHNPESQKIEPDQISTKNNNGFEIIGKEMGYKEIIQEIEKDIIFYDESGGGVTFSGGEPFMQFEFLQTLLRECKTLGISTAVDTTGYTTLKKIKQLAEYIDIFLYDIKLVKDDLHKKYTGVSNKIIIENLSYLLSSNKEVFIRTPIIPSITDSTENIKAIGEYLATFKREIHIDILPYNKMGIEKVHRLQKTYRLSHIPELTKSKLNSVKEELEKYGLDVKIGG
ncbi:MAG: glycyl-radical enzyme activating protein [Candidatus Hodarchaeales archaeon]